MTTRELYDKAGENTLRGYARKKIIQTVKKVDMVDDVYFVKMEPEEIRRRVDMDYRGDGEDVLVVEYEPECYTTPAMIWNWYGQRPESIAEAIEI